MGEITDISGVSDEVFFDSGFATIDIGDVADGRKGEIADTDWDYDVHSRGLPALQTGNVTK